MIRAWNLVKTDLAAIVPESTITLWVNPLIFREINEKLCELIAPDRYFRSWVMGNLFDDIKKCFAARQEGIKINLVVGDEQARSTVSNPNDKKDDQLRLPRMPQVNNSIRTLHPRFTFDEFMVGESNAMANIACEAIANDDSSLGRSIFLESGPGFGKSHLTHAVAHKIQAESPSTVINYLSGQQLTAEFVKSIRSNQMGSFREKYQNCDVLLIEDIQVLSGRIKTQEELTMALDILMNQQKRIILTSKVPPKDIPDINPELLSRLAGGLIATINPPDLRTRQLIIKKKSDYHALNLDDESICYLAEHITGDIRQVESAIIGLKAKISLLNCQLDLDILKEVIGGMALVSNGTVSAADIQGFISKQFQLSADQLKSKSRTREIAFPRQVGMYLSRKFTNQGLAEIGRAFNRDHSTVVHSIRVITDSISRSGSIKGQLDLLGEKIRKQYF